MLQETVQNFSGSNTVAVEIPADTLIPDELVIIHEHSDHYSTLIPDELVTMHEHRSLFNSAAGGDIAECPELKADQVSDTARSMDDTRGVLR